MPEMTELQGEILDGRTKPEAMPVQNRGSATVVGPRVALLTCYNGGNFGDAAIQDAVIANLRLRLADLRIAGITLCLEMFLERHGTDAFPLFVSKLPFYEMGSPGASEQFALPVNPDGPNTGASGWKHVLKGVLRAIPPVRRLAKKLRPYVETAAREMRHAVDGYRFLRGYSLLIVSGGGQLDSECGGPWGHPYSLFKWAMIAKLARVPVAIVSVGAGKTNLAMTRFFLRMALRAANYRSYREQHTRASTAKWFAKAPKDYVVPDLAFSLPLFAMPAPSGLKSLAKGRPIIAISPIAYGKPGTWHPDQQLYERYKHHLAEIVSLVIKRGYFVVLVWSSIGDDDKTVSELIAQLDGDAFRQHIYLPKITSWKEFAAMLSDADYLIASRLHSTILGFMTSTPTVAISFDPKVDWVMQDVGQTEYLLQISNFEVQDVIQALDRLAANRESVVHQILSYRESIAPLFSAQYDALAKLALRNSPVRP
jgi:polysaccharide pyruvyl transferase WcaK-like protein